MNEYYDNSLKTFSGFTDVKCTISSPMSLTTDMTFKKLTILTGLNNSGKSLIQKLLWATHTFFNMKLVEKITGIKDNDKTDNEIFKFILDNTFSEQNFTGEFEWHQRDDLLKVSFYSIKYTILNGIITDLNMSWPDDAQPGGKATYLSKDARDFNNIERYLKTKKMLNITDITSWSNLEALSEWYKLYDIFAIETSLVKFEKTNEMLNMLKILGGGDQILNGLDLVNIKVDQPAGKLYYINSKNEEKSLSSLGAGEQSIIMMLMSAL